MTCPAAIDLAAADTTPVLPSNGLFARCAERFRFWREKRRWVNELHDAAEMDRLDAILDDIGLTHAEFDELVAAPADAGRQFDQMAALEGVDLGRLSADTLRRATWTCTRCTCRAACKRWLRTGVWEFDGDPRCPNAALLHHD